MKKKYTREEIYQLFSLYNRCEKYDLIIELAKWLIEDNPELSQLEQSIFLQGYKSKIYKERKSLIKLLEIEKKEKKRKSSHAHYIREIINPAIKSLLEITDDFDKQIDILIPKAKTFDEMVYFYRLKCDFIRYKCQFLEKEQLKDEINKYEITFGKGEKIALQYLEKWSIRYLEFMLGKCVFMYEIMNQKKEPIELARKVINPLKENENLDSETKKIFDLFKSNIIIWSGKCEADVII